jgi:hypothetical protein
MMKKALSIQSVILILATLIAIALTIYIGGFGADSSAFYWNCVLINITFIGDAFFAFGLAFFLLFFFNKKSIALKLLIVVLISLTITQVIKNLFSGLQPQLFFEEGVLQNSGETFFNRNVISSHTAIAFTLAGFLVLHTKILFLKIIAFALAIIVALTGMELVGYSLLALSLGLLPATVALIYLYSLKYKREIGKKIYYYKSRKETTASVGKQFLRV